MADIHQQTLRGHISATPGSGLQLSENFQLFSIFFFFYKLKGAENAAPECPLNFEMWHWMYLISTLFHLFSYIVRTWKEASSWIFCELWAGRTRTKLTRVAFSSNHTMDSPSPTSSTSVFQNTAMTWRPGSSSSSKPEPVEWALSGDFAKPFRSSMLMISKSTWRPWTLKIQIQFRDRVVESDDEGLDFGRSENVLHISISFRSRCLCWRTFFLLLFQLKKMVKKVSLFL